MLPTGEVERLRSDLADKEARLAALEEMVQAMSKLVDQAYGQSNARFLCVAPKNFNGRTPMGPCFCSTCALTHKMYVGCLVFLAEG